LLRFQTELRYSEEQIIRILQEGEAAENIRVGLARVSEKMANGVA